MFFYKVKNDGYTLTTRRRPKSGINDLDEFINIHEEMLKSDYLDKVDSDNITYIEREKIINDPNVSLLLSHYIDEQKTGYIRLGEILERVKEKNSDGYETASITNSEIWGMPLGSDLWGENFYSVTSADNISYSIVDKKYISFNPARANIGSFGINMSNNKLSVSSAYPVFRVKQEKIKEYLPEYVFLEIKYNQEVIDDINERAYGTIRQSLSVTDFLKLQIRDIDIEKQKVVVNNFKSKYKKFRKLEEELFEFKPE